MYLGDKAVGMGSLKSSIQIEQLRVPIIHNLAFNKPVHGTQNFHTMTLLYFSSLVLNYYQYLYETKFHFANFVNIIKKQNNLSFRNLMVHISRQRQYSQCPQININYILLFDDVWVLCIINYQICIYNKRVSKLQMNQILNQALTQQIQTINKQPKHEALQSVTVLLIFLIIVINQIFLISLIAILLKKIKFVIKSTAKKYYYFVIFYIVSKLSLCIFLQIKILSGIADQFKDVDSQTVQKIFNNSLVFADCSIVELFLIAFQHYLALSFSIFGSKKTQRTIRILMQGAQLVTFFTILIPLLLFNINIINFQTLNIFTMSINCLNVIAFIAAFFFMNFKMTGLMMQKKSSQIIKRVYALLLALLVSRLIMSAVQVWVEINITNGSFQDFITIIQQNQNQYVVLGLCFIAYLLIILLTQGLPLIMSLRQSLVMALTQAIKSRSRPASFDQSVITSDNSIKEDLLGSMDMVQQQDSMTQKNTYRPSNEGSSSLSKIENPAELQLVQKIMSIREDFVVFKAKWTKNQKFYFVKKLGNISNYIIEQILNQIEVFKKYDLKLLNPMKVLEGSNENNENQIYLVQKFLCFNLKQKMEKINSQTLKTKIDLALKIAKAIQQFHEVLKMGHGVLNTKNIMFDNEDNVILTGFGMQSLKKYLSLTSQYSNISFYTATQLFGTNRQKTVSKPTKQSDIYSFGIIFYEIISGNYKYRNLSLAQVRKKFVTQNTRPKIPENIDDGIKQIMRKCWQQNPENRPDMKWIISNLQTIKSRQ